MPIEIIVPRLGWSMEEGAFVAWLKKEGEFVPAGELLFSIEGDKAVQEIESIDSGVLRIAPDCPKPGGQVRVGDLLGYLLVENEKMPMEISAAQPLAASGPAAQSSPGGAALAETTAFRQPRATDSATRRPAISPRALRAA